MMSLSSRVAMVAFCDWSSGSSPIVSPACRIPEPCRIRSRTAYVFVAISDLPAVLAGGLGDPQGVQLREDGRAMLSRDEDRLAMGDGVKDLADPNFDGPGVLRVIRLPDDRACHLSPLS